MSNGGLVLYGMGHFTSCILLNNIDSNLSMETYYVANESISFITNAQSRVPNLSGYIHSPSKG